MQTTSSLYQTLLRDKNHRKEIKINIAGEDYFEDRIVSISTQSGLFPEDTFSAGGATAAMIDLSIIHFGNIPKMAEMKPCFRLVLNGQVSEWVQKGVFYIDTRYLDEATGVLSIQGYDGMYKGEIVWEPRQHLSFPMTMRAAAEEIALLMGTTIDSRTQINTSYYVDYPANDYTLRDILRFIAAAHGGNWIMTDVGQLRLITLNDIPPETHYLVTEYGDAIVFGRDRILV